MVADLPPGSLCLLQNITHELTDVQSPADFSRPPARPRAAPRNLLPLPEGGAIIATVSGELKRGACLIRVKVRMNESLDQLLKRFKKACEKEGLTRDIKRTAFYEKPSEKRRRQERQLIRKMQKEANLR